MSIHCFPLTPTHDGWKGIYGPTKKSHEAIPEKSDHVTHTNLRGLWLFAREELKKNMISEDVGRPGFRGSIVRVGKPWLYGNQKLERIHYL